MLRKWIAKGLAIALCTGAIAPLSGEETPYSYSGQQIITEVEASYQKGEYEIFLEQLHEQYQRAGKAGVLRGVFESAKAVMPVSATVQDQKEYRSELSKIDRERNQQLLEAIGDNKNSPIGHKIEEIASYKISQDQIDVLAELDTLKYQVPKDAKATMDNKIAALEIEYYIKSLLLDVASTKSGSSSEELNKKKIALTLKKLDLMEAAAQEYNDEIWMKKIALAKEGFRADKAYKMDVEVLKELAAGNIDPENPVEEKVKGIMIDFLSQRTAKTDQYIADLGKS